MKYYLSFFLLTSTFVFAQPGGGGDPGAGEPVPLTGIGFLILSGALLGIRSILSKKRNNNTGE